MSNRSTPKAGSPQEETEMNSRTSWTCSGCGASATYDEKGWLKCPCNCATGGTFTTPASLPLARKATPESTRTRELAPHPLGATLGPAAIKPRRAEPLLVAEIIRLLERHGVPWNQAVREAAGLMAQTVEEAEGWWAFEMCHEESPSDEEMIRLKRLESAPDPRPIAPTADFKQLLDESRDAWWEYGLWLVYERDKYVAKAFSFDRIDASRKAVEDYVERIRSDGVIAAIDLQTSKRHAEILRAELASLRDSQK